MEKQMSTEDFKNSNVTCVRAPRDKEHPYFMTARAPAQDTQNLSLDERGMLWYILSLPSNWIAHPMHLAKSNGIGSKEKIYRILKSLMKAGYCERITTRKNGRHESTCYMFYEDKQLRLIELYNPAEDCLSDNRKLETQDSDLSTPVLSIPINRYIKEEDISKEKKRKKEEIRKRDLLTAIKFDRTSSKFINISEDDMKDWAVICPGVDIPRELGKMKNWLLDTKNKHRDIGRTFIVNWLDRCWKELQYAEQPTQNQTDLMPYNDSIAYSILNEDGEDEYVDYLKSVSDQKYYKNYQKGNYENYYIEYTKLQGN